MTRSISGASRRMRRTIAGSASTPHGGPEGAPRGRGIEFGTGGDDRADVGKHGLDLRVKRQRAPGRLHVAPIDEILYVAG
jgi:hypothetical protein